MGMFNVPVIKYKVSEMILMPVVVVFIRPETILLKDVRSTQHVKNALDFLEQRKNRVPRSNAVLKNASKALRLLSSKGNFLS
jgi:hypothetical protein